MLPMACGLHTAVAMQQKAWISLLVLLLALSVAGQTLSDIRKLKFHLCICPKASSTNQIELVKRIEDHASKAPEAIRPWTTAVVLREPHERLLSTYLDSHPHYPPVPPSASFKPGHPPILPNGIAWVTCDADAEYFDGFVKRLVSMILDGKMLDEHVAPQRQLCTGSYNHTIRFDDMEHGMQRLLRDLGVWEQVGSTGWGADGKQHFMASSALTLNSKGVGTTAKLLPVFYNAQTWELVNIAFDKDMEIFPEARNMLGYFQLKGLAGSIQANFTEHVTKELQKVVQRGHWCFDPSYWTHVSSYCGCGERKILKKAYKAERDV